VANFTNWPVVALLFGVIFIFAFYGPIHRFLERANKIGSQGFEASSDSAAAQEKSATREQTVEGISSQADQLLRVFDNQLLLEGEKYIKEDLDKRNITNPAERERVLIRLVSVTGTAALFERAYILIFGSQIRALQTLNARLLQKQELVPFYVAAKSEYQNIYSNYAFDQWFNFMLSQTFIIMQGNTVGITNRGREFLKYLIQEAHSVNKAG